MGEEQLAEAAVEEAEPAVLKAKLKRLSAYIYRLVGLLQLSGPDGCAAS